MATGGLGNANQSLQAGGLGELAQQSALKKSPRALSLLTEPKGLLHCSAGMWARKVGNLVRPAVRNTKQEQSHVSPSLLSIPGAGASLRAASPHP